MHLYIECVGHDARTGDKTASADRHHQCVERDPFFAKIFNQLEGCRCLAGDNVWMIERRNDHSSALLYMAERCVLSLSARRSGECDLGSELSDGVDFYLRSVFGHENMRADVV